MPLEYVGKVKVTIPDIGENVPCIRVNLTTWDGWAQKNNMEDLVIPIGQDKITMHPRHATAYGFAALKEGKVMTSCLAPSLKNYSEAVGKRVSWAKLPLPGYKRPWET